MLKNPKKRKIINDSFSNHVDLLASSQLTFYFMFSYLSLIDFCLFEKLFSSLE